MTTSTDEIPPTDGLPAGKRRDRGIWYASSALALFALFLYGDLLFSRSGVVMSHEFGDTCGAFVWWRQFGFDELAKGNLPLWNPYVFCGAPFVGNIQSAMFYPVNALLYLSLPLPNAINAEIVFHTLLAGFSMLAWTRNRGIGWLPGVLAATVVMAGAPVSMRLNLGQLNVFAVFAWLPLTLLVVDKLLQRVSAGWMLLGILSVSMQLLAGYPPSAYNNGLAVALYCLLRLMRHPNHFRTGIALAVVAVVPFFIAAAPLAAGYHSTRESLRVDGTSLEFASSWSLPPENLLTALTPLFFGDYTNVNYWGRWCLWDVCVFIGIGSLTLLAYGAILAPRHSRAFAGTMLFLLLLAALGRYTPFFTLLYYCVPGLASFRAPSKLLLPALVFAALLAGLGANELINRPKRTQQFAAVAATTAVGLLAIGIALRYFPSILDKPDGLWTLLVAGMEQSGETYWWFEMDDLAMETSVWIASMSALTGAVTCFALAFLLYRAPIGKRYRVALICFSAAEILLFARYDRVTSDIHTMTSTALEQLRTEDTGDYRELQAKSINPNWRRNYPMSIRMKTAWGYDPVMLKRYAEFFAFALGGQHRYSYMLNDVILTNILDPISMALMTGALRFEFVPTNAQQAHPFVGLPRLLRLTRCKYVYFWPEPVGGVLGGIEGVYQVRDPFPRFSIYRNYIVATDNRAALDIFAQDGVDIGQTLVLEREPSPAPIAGAENSASPNDRIELIGESSDHIEIQIQLATPGILLIADAYSDGWNATPLMGSSQANYTILPANHAFQALPLGAGLHRIRLEYAPAVVIAGMWVSVVSTFGVLTLCFAWMWGMRRGYSWS